MFGTEYPDRILKSKRRDRRGRKAAECAKGLDIRNDPRPPGGVEPGNGKTNFHVYYSNFLRVREKGRFLRGLL
jgi:hypothetical protein